MIHQKIMDSSISMTCCFAKWASVNHTSPNSIWNGLLGQRDFPVTWDAKSQNLVTWGWFIDGFTTLRWSQLFPGWPSTFLSWRVHNFSSMGYQESSGGFWVQKIESPFSASFLIKLDDPGCPWRQDRRVLGAFLSLSHNSWFENSQPI